MQFPTGCFFLLPLYGPSGWRRHQCLMEDFFSATVLVMNVSGLRFFYAGELYKDYLQRVLGMMFFCSPVSCDVSGEHTTTLNVN